MEKIFLFIYDIIFGGLGVGGAFQDSFGVEMWNFWNTYRIWSFFFSAFCFIVVTIYVYKLRELRRAEYCDYTDPIEGVASTEGLRGNEDWERVKNLIASANISDWKIAVLEADKLLDQLVTDLGYVGEDLGGKLMSIDRKDFRTLEEAWQAHKFRNHIAHTPKLELERSAFEGAINNFEKVFREFDFI